MELERINKKIEHKAALQNYSMVGKITSSNSDRNC